MTDQPETRDCGRSKPHPAHRHMLGRQLWQCPGSATIRTVLDVPAGQPVLDRILADAARHATAAAEAKTERTQGIHEGMAAAFHDAAEHVRRGRDAEPEASQRRAVPNLSDFLDRTLANALGQPLLDRINKHLADGEQAEKAVARVRAELEAIEREARAMNPYDRDPTAELERIRAALDATA